MASRQILPESLGPFGTGSKQDLGSPVRSKTSSLNNTSVKRARPVGNMYRDTTDDMGDDDGVGGQQFGSSMLYSGGNGDKDLNNMYTSTSSQPASSGYYGVGPAFQNISSASVHNAVPATNTSSMGSRGAQYAGTGSRAVQHVSSVSMQTNPLTTPIVASSLAGSNAGLPGRSSILSPSASGLGQQQSQFSFVSAGSAVSLPMSNPPKLSRSMSATAATSQSTAVSAFPTQMRLARNTTPSGFENRSFVPQQPTTSLDSQQSLDLSDFPVVGNRTNGRRPQQGPVTATPALASGPAPIPTATRNYGIASKPREQEFTMVSEDFPALPSSGNFKTGMGEAGDVKLSQGIFPLSMASSQGFGGMNLSGGVGGDSFRIGSIPMDTSHQDAHPRSSNVGVIGQRPAKGAAYHGAPEQLIGQQQGQSAGYQQVRPGIQTTSDGVITNIPQGMVKDQFGLIGLLTFIRVAENEPNLVSLALGTDLTTLGLNLTSPDTLCGSFTSPFVDGPTRPQDIDFAVPDEYNTNNLIRDKLAPIKLHRYGEDLLFYLYYHSSGDLLQLAAAAELYQRDWRYHKEQRVWLTRAVGLESPLTVKNTMYETGRYYVFDVVTWRKAVHDMHIEYDQLEDTPHLPKSYQLQQHQGATHHPSLSQLL